MTSRYKFILICIVYYLISSLYITGCTSTSVEHTQNSNIDYSNMQNTIVDTLLESEYETEATLQNIDFTKMYYSVGAVYLQSGTYMYRFQLNSNNEIDSYVRYSLEG